MQDEAPERRTSPFGAFRHRDFRLYMSGMAVSLAGTSMQQLAQSWLVYRLTHSAWMLGVTWFCANIPVLLLGPLAGLASDRFPRRRIVVAAQVVAMLQAFVLAVLTLSGRITVTHVLVLALLLGTCNVFDMAGRQAMFVHLVGKDDLLGAISLNSATFNSARVIGPALAGFLVGRLGEGLCFLINGFSFLAVLASLALMRFQEPAHVPGEGPLERLRGGFRLAAGTPPLRTAFLLVSSMAVATASVSALGPMFADGIFHMGAQGLGLLTGGMGLGAIAGTLTLASSRGFRRLPGVVMQALFVASATLIVFAASPNYWLSLGMMTLLGMSIFRTNTATNTMIQLRVPENYRGRIMGLYSSMVVGMLPVASLISGALAAHIGPRWTVALGGVLALFAGVHARRNQQVLKNWLEAPNAGADVGLS
jgi:MFS family permease